MSRNVCLFPKIHTVLEKEEFPQEVLKGSVCFHPPKLTGFIQTAYKASVVNKSNSRKINGKMYKGFFFNFLFILTFINCEWQSYDTIIPDSTPEKLNNLVPFFFFIKLCLVNNFYISLTNWNMAWLTLETTAMSFIIHILSITIV